jgi:hypothetical protein
VAALSGNDSAPPRVSGRGMLSRMFPAEPIAIKRLVLATTVVALLGGCRRPTPDANDGREASISSSPPTAGCKGLELRDARGNVRIFRGAERWSAKDPPWDLRPDWQAACRGSTFYVSGRSPEVVGLCERGGQILAVVVMSRLASNDPNRAHFGVMTVRTSGVRTEGTSRCAQIEADAMLESQHRTFTVTGGHWFSSEEPPLSASLRGEISLE